VLIVDPSPLIRFGMKTLLADFCICQRVLEAEPSMLVHHLQGAPWDTVILGFAAGEGPALLDAVQTWQPEARVLLLSSQAEPQYAIKALRAGAAGYVLASASTGEIVRAIGTMAKGESHVSPVLAVKLAQAEAQCLAHEKLSPREFEVLIRIARGHRLLDVAEAMGLNTKTVSTYRTRIVKKMGLTSDAELVMYCVRHGLIPLD
jgi:DNA-binding NarL/FixJ family response regulator